MNQWRYFDITHRDHEICNPTSSEKLDEMLGLLALPEGSRALDIACGKAEFTVRVVERYGARSVGVDLAPTFVEAARQRVAERVPDADVEILEMDAADYHPEPESFDLSICLGASWIWGGHRGTLDALRGFTREGGQILVGEIFWKQEPPDEYLEGFGLTRDSCGSHFDNVQTAIDVGLTPLYTMVSNGDDFDRYEALQWRAAELWAAANPDDPDRKAILERCRSYRDLYLRWGREVLGWSLYLFRK